MSAASFWWIEILKYLAFFLSFSNYVRAYRDTGVLGYLEADWHEDFVVVESPDFVFEVS